MPEHLIVRCCAKAIRKTAVWKPDLVYRLPDASATVAVLWETSAGVGSLTLEDPWLAAALSDGTVALLNTEVAMRQRHHRANSSASAPPKRLFQLPAGAAHCADLADQWLVAGSGSAHL